MTSLLDWPYEKFKENLLSGCKAKQKNHHENVCMHKTGAKQSYFVNV